MEEIFRAKNSYSKEGTRYESIKDDLFYELEVGTRIAFDQRQVLQIRAALKNCQDTLEKIFQERITQLAASKPLIRDKEVETEL